MPVLAARWHAEGLAGPSERLLLTPDGMVAGSAEHLRFITLTRGISGLYPEVELWQRSARLWADEATRWLFDTERVAYADWRAVEAALKRQALAQRRQDVRGWYDTARGLQGRFKGEVSSLIEAGGGTVSGLLSYLTHNRTTFPLLAGEETARLWLDQLRRLGGVEIEEDEALEITLGKKARQALKTLAIDVPEWLPVQEALAVEVWAGLDTETHQEVLQAIK
ncbi:MAG: hypothetical protein KDD73_13225 [Anaerolineales bacterium]|nr:hypothetical protein [Anaerolineales bacterium]